MNKNNFMSTDNKELCRFYDSCFNPEAAKSMYKNGNGQKLLKIERQEYHECCIKGGQCGELYNNLVLIEKREPTKVNSSGMRMDQERKVEEFFFKKREQDLEIQKMKGDEIYELVREEE